MGARGAMPPQVGAGMMPSAGIGGPKYIPGAAPGGPPPGMVPPGGQVMQPAVMPPSAMPPPGGYVPPARPVMSAPPQAGVNPLPNQIALANRLRASQGRF